MIILAVCVPVASAAYQIIETQVIDTAGLRLKEGVSQMDYHLEQMVQMTQNVKQDQNFKILNRVKGELPPEQYLALSGFNDYLKNMKISSSFSPFLFSTFQNNDAEELSYITRFGKEGVDWTNDPEVCKEYTSAYKEMGLVDKIDVVYNYKTDVDVWSNPSNTFWHNVGPRYFPMEKGNAQADGSVDYDPEVRSLQVKAWNYEYYNGKHPEQMLPLLKYTLEESDETAIIITHIDEFIDTSMAEFITGQRSLDDAGWQKYLDELNGLGLDTWLQTAQTAFERSN